MPLPEKPADPITGNILINFQWRSHSKGVILQNKYILHSHLSHTYIQLQKELPKTQKRQLSL